MNKIKKLDQSVIQKIAAGEIVERPAHIIKELLENALDARATTIELTIISGGKDAIIIQDNGSGMNKDDALMSIEHHTTSKLERAEDLETIHTYGFRGEALSSISSVSIITLTTRDNTNSEGFEVEVIGGVIKSTRVTSAPIGTTLSVKDLFFNVPARKKFLKKDSTELNHCKQLFYATCFQALSVYLSFTNDNKILFSCPAVKTVSDRYMQLEGIEAQSHMIPLIPFSFEGLTISGLISDTQYVSYDRSDIFIFVNNRWIKNTTLTRALINGYSGSLPAQKYPRAVLYITIDPREVDINIHPKKEEVRFLHPRRIEQRVEESVRKTLESKIPHVQHQSINQFQKTTSILYQDIVPVSSIARQISHEYEPMQQKRDAFPSLKPTTIISQPMQQEQFVSVNDIMQQRGIPEAEKTQKNILEEEFMCIGQVFNTYILASAHNILYIIDQHAAHERIMFEKTISNHQGLLAIKQAFPLLITIKPSDQLYILSYEHIFSQCGIEVEKFDETHLIVTATPAQITHHNLEELFKELISIINQHETINTQTIEEKLLHHVRCHIACKSAVKAGDQLDTIAMMQLISDLSRVPNRFCCPHGRPTMWEITIAELEKWFKRRM